jgi:C-terminal processing protease CtpA/Prc
MTQAEVVEQVIDIMHHDYSGYIDKKGWDNPEKLRAKVKNNDLSQKEFFLSVEEYLLDFGRKHLTLADKLAVDFARGFDVRRYGDSLFVTRVWDQEGIQVGDEITKLDDLTIKEFAEFHQSVLDETIERQRFEILLKRVSEVTLKDGSVVLLKESEKDDLADRDYSFKQLNDETCLIALPNFWDFAKMNAFMEEYASEFSKFENMIIDVRVNGGGKSAMFFKLLDYLFDKDTSFDEVDNKEDYRLWNLTERNTNFWGAAIKAVAENPAVDEKEQKLFYEMYQKIEANSGKGFTRLSFGGEEEDVIHGTEKPSKVIVMTDIYCGSSGDSFVETVNASPIVTSIGRNTWGMQDYTEVVSAEFEEFDLRYAGCKSALAGTPQGQDKTGVPVDIHIPWTPEHLKRDVDLETALEILG